MLKEKKPQEVKKMKELIEKYSIVGILNMRKLPAKQLQQIRSQLGGSAIIRMSRKTLMKKAIDASKKEGIGQIGESLGTKSVIPAFVVSDENPFRLFRILKENRTAAAAKPGDVAPDDIVISKGPTSLPPGPAISTLQKVGLAASVQDGKIHVMRDKVVSKKGEVITEDVASVLNLLKLEPMEIGLDLVTVLEGGTIYGKDVLNIDVDDYVKQIQDAIQKGLNLSLHTGFLTSETAPLAISKAFSEARALCMNADILDSEFIGDVLAKAVRAAKELEEKAGPLETKYEGTGEVQDGDQGIEAE